MSGVVPKVKESQQSFYNCQVDSRKASGVVALVAAAAMLVFAVLLAAGIFGGGEMGYLAGGLTVGSVLSFALAAFLLIPKKSHHSD